MGTRPFDPSRLYVLDVLETFAIPMTTGELVAEIQARHPEVTVPAIRGAVRRLDLAGWLVHTTDDDEHRYSVTGEVDWSAIEPETSRVA